MPIFRYDSDLEEIGKVLDNKELLIPEPHLKNVCKKSAGLCACRYIALTPIGHICVKNTILRKDVIRNMKTNKRWKAMGDNCDGFGLTYGEAKEAQAGGEEAHPAEEQDGSPQSNPS